MKKSDLDIIASQLENPKGAKGLEMGDMISLLLKLTTYSIHTFCHYAISKF